MEAEDKQRALADAVAAWKAASMRAKIVRDEADIAFEAVMIATGVTQEDTIIEEIHNDMSTVGVITPIEYITIGKCGNVWRTPRWQDTKNDPEPK